MISQLNSFHDIWDIIVIGGGATGLGTALDAAARGYKTLLLEKYDFAKGTSSRSTKLVHGGVRYLQQGDVSLVLEALHERGLLVQNAPHLVREQSFVIPNYDWWGGPFYAVGLKVYDLMSGKLGLGSSKKLSVAETVEAIPTVETKGLRGGVRYSDGQFDDSRLAVNLVQTFCEHGGTAINYMGVKGLTKASDMVDGVIAEDAETGETHEIKARVVVNATGVFTDDILKMENPDAKQTIVPSQGVHVVLDKSFLPGESAVMIPQTSDGRVLFAVPWNGKVVVGTTDTLIKAPEPEPKALEEEIQFILSTASQYLQKAPSRADVLSVFAGLRPLAAPEDGSKSTKEISRGHKLMVTISGLVTITGGKWTTYRKMGEDTVDKAALIAGLHEVPCPTKNMRIHGWLKNIPSDDPLKHYGSDAIAIRKLVKEQPDMGEVLHPNLPFIKAQVLWAAKKEMARSIEDVLARRVRALFLDARAAIEMAPEVGRILKEALGKDEAWQKQQVETFTKMAKDYLLA